MLNQKLSIQCIQRRDDPGEERECDYVRRAAASRGSHIITSPPSTPSTWPVTYAASSDAKKAKRTPHAG